MKSFVVRNLTELSAQAALPWEFIPTENLSVQLRNDKKARQDWYKTVSTNHQFYSFFEGANAQMRASKDNPPKRAHGFAADFDLPLTDERVLEVAASMKIKPAWFERSLGGNVRLVWLFESPMLVESYEFATFVLQEAQKWLSLGMLPGLDEGAFQDPARLLCNGCAWKSTGHGPIPAADAQAFFVRCGSGYRLSPAEAGAAVPLDIVLSALQTLFPNFSWPGDFVPGTQGPSFWIPESTTPLSAIVKAEGMFTFSAHATKPFYSWNDILGPDFVEQYTTKAISTATTEIYWDGKRFWRKINNLYCSLDSPELQNFFKVTCKMSAKPGKDGLSLIDKSLEHIYNSNRITGAAPHLFRPPGLLEFHGKRIINTYIHRVMNPAEEITPWGPEGKFPFLSLHFDNFFDPPEQKWWFLAWWKAFWESGFYMRPMPGQNCFFMGAVNTGKTLTSRGIVGRSVGGFVDASAYIIEGAGFNSELLEAPLWALDDETPSANAAASDKLQAMLKKTTANQQFQHNKKFEVSCTTEWMGRIICTTNLDYISSRVLGPMDNSSLDKTNVFRCAARGKVVFPNRHELHQILEREIPYCLRWLQNYDPTQHGVTTDVRYGYAAFHEPSLLEQAHQGGKSAPFKELLYEALFDYFRTTPDAPHWKGSLTQLVRMIHSNPLNDNVVRSLRLEQTNRYLELIQREALFQCTVETGPLGTRIWIFKRFDNLLK